MSMGQNQRQWWQTIMSWAAFLARTPVALLIIAVAAFGSFVGLLFAYRLTEYIYTTFLDHAW